MNNYTPEAKHSDFQLSVSALICTRGRGDSLVPTVSSILHPGSICQELLVIDQSEDSRTEDALTPFRDDPRLRYIRLHSKGKGKSLNFGLEQAKGDIVAITDDDCEVPPEWPFHHADILARYPRVAVTYGNVLPAEHDSSAGFIPAYTIKKDRLFRSIWQKPTARGIGADTAVRRDVVLRMGGFDAACCPGGKFHACVDGDLTARVLLAGYEVYEVQKSSVLHYGFRNWEQGRTLTKNAWTGIGAAFAKPLKCGRWDALPVPLYEFFWHALLPFLWATLTFRKARGWLRVRYFVKGFVEGLRTPVDTKTLLYVPPPPQR